MNPIVKWVLQTMMKGQTGVVRTLPNKKLLDINVNMTVERLIKNGIDPSAIKTPGQVDNIIKQIEQPKVIPADSPRGRGITEALFGKKGEVFDMEGKKIKPGSKIMGGKEVKDSNVDAIIQDIKSLEPITAMKEANNIIARKGKYKNLTKSESKKILQETEDHIFERDVPFDPQEDFAIGGRVGYKDGPDVPGRRKFMKIMGGLATIPFVGKFFKSAKTAAPAVEKAAEVVGQAPSYFFDLVAKIKLLGQPRRTPSYRDRVNEYKYTGKDGNEYLLTEELDTGDIMIQKDKLGGRNYGDESYEVIEDRTEMVYRKGQADETTKGTPADDYEEYKVEFDQDGTAADATDIDEISKSEIIKEITGDAKSIKKADGGIAMMLGE